MVCITIETSSSLSVVSILDRRRLDHRLVHCRRDRRLVHRRRDRRRRDRDRRSSSLSPCVLFGFGPRT